MISRRSRTKRNNLIESESKADSGFARSTAARSTARNRESELATIQEKKSSSTNRNSPESKESRTRSKTTENVSRSSTTSVSRKFSYKKLVEARSLQSQNKHRKNIISYRFFPKYDNFLKILTKTLGPQKPQRCFIKFSVDDWEIMFMNASMNIQSFVKISLPVGMEKTVHNSDKSSKKDRRNSEEKTEIYYNFLKNYKHFLETINADTGAKLQIDYESLKQQLLLAKNEKEKNAKSNKFDHKIRPEDEESYVKYMKNKMAENIDMEWLNDMGDCLVSKDLNEDKDQTVESKILENSKHKTTNLAIAKNFQKNTSSKISDLSAYFCWAIRINVYRNNLDKSSRIEIIKEMFNQEFDVEKFQEEGSKAYFDRRLKNMKVNEVVETIMVDRTPVKNELIDLTDSTICENRSGNNENTSSSDDSENDSNPSDNVIYNPHTNRSLWHPNDIRQLIKGFGNFSLKSKNLAAIPDIKPKILKFERNIQAFHTLQFSANCTLVHNIRYITPKPNQAKFVIYLKKDALLYRSLDATVTETFYVKQGILNPDRPFDISKLSRSISQYHRNKVVFIRDLSYFEDGEIYEIEFYWYKLKKIFSLMKADQVLNMSFERHEFNDYGGEEAHQNSNDNTLLYFKFITSNCAENNLYMTCDCSYIKLVKEWPIPEERTDPATKRLVDATNTLLQESKIDQSKSRMDPESSKSKRKFEQILTPIKDRSRAVSPETIEVTRLEKMRSSINVENSNSNTSSYKTKTPIKKKVKLDDISKINLPIGENTPAKQSGRGKRNSNHRSTPISDQRSTRSTSEVMKIPETNNDSAATIRGPSNLSRESSQKSKFYSNIMTNDNLTSDLSSLRPPSVDSGRQIDEDIQISSTNRSKSFADKTITYHSHYSKTSFIQDSSDSRKMPKTISNLKTNNEKNIQTSTQKEDNSFRKLIEVNQVKAKMFDISAIAYADKNIERANNNRTVHTNSSRLRNFEKTTKMKSCAHPEISNSTKIRNVNCTKRVSNIIPLERTRSDPVAKSKANLRKPLLDTKCTSKKTINTNFGQRLPNMKFPTIQFIRKNQNNYASILSRQVEDCKRHLNIEVMINQIKVKDPRIFRRVEKKCETYQKSFLRNYKNDL